MKSILLSIKPKYVELIASGQKTIEVRKTAPQEVPFKCYIYESRNGGHRCKHCNEKDSCYSYAPKNVGCYNGRGKVIGEFICDKVYMSFVGYMKNEPCYWDILNGSCLTKDEIMNYGKWKTLYGWHISDLKIYDKPRELSEFRKPCDWNYDCCTCKRAKYELTKAEAKVFYGCDSELTRPPQSWMYVEDLGD